MKRITKKQSAEFFAKAEIFLLEKGFEVAEERDDRRIFRKTGTTNNVKATLERNQDGTVYSLFFIFDNAVQPFTNVSGKANFHEHANDPMVFPYLRLHIERVCNNLQ